LELDIGLLERQLESWLTDKDLQEDLTDSGGVHCSAVKQLMYTMTFMRRKHFLHPPNKIQNLTAAFLDTGKNHSINHRADLS